MKHLLSSASLAVFVFGCSSSAVGTGTPSNGANGANGGDTTVAAGGTSTNGAAPSVPLPDGAKRVFVTAARYEGALHEAPATDGDPADALCAATAEAAELGGTWRAFMDPTSTTKDAFDHVAGDGPWYTVDGKKAFNNAANLRTTALSPIDVDESGHYVSHVDYVWTGHCSVRTEYDSTEYASAVTVGTIRNPAMRECAYYSAHLYCFEE